MGSVLPTNDTMLKAIKLSAIKILSGVSYRQQWPLRGLRMIVERRKGRLCSHHSRSQARVHEKAPTEYYGHRNIRKVHAEGAHDSSNTQSTTPRCTKQRGCSRYGRQSFPWQCVVIVCSGKYTEAGVTNGGSRTCSPTPDPKWTIKDTGKRRVFALTDA